LTDKNKKETSVLALRGTDIADGDIYSEDMALEIFKNYIFPNILMSPSEDGDSSNYISIPISGNAKTSIESVKRALVTWLFNHDGDVDVEGFNESEFERINKAAYEKLLNSTMKDIFNMKAFDGELPTIKLLNLSDAAKKNIKKFVELNDYPQDLDMVEREMARLGEVDGIALTMPMINDYLKENLKDNPREFLIRLETKVNSSQLFDDNITLKDIKEQTAESQYFFKLAPNEADDPIVQKLLETLEDVPVAEETITEAQELYRESPLQGNIFKNFVKVASSKQLQDLINKLKNEAGESWLEELDKAKISLKDTAGKATNYKKTVETLLNLTDKEGIALFDSEEEIDKHYALFIAYSFDMYFTKKGTAKTELKEGEYNNYNLLHIFHEEPEYDKVKKSLDDIVEDLLKASKRTKRGTGEFPASIYTKEAQYIQEWLKDEGRYILTFDNTFPSEADAEKVNELFVFIAQYNSMLPATSIRRTAGGVETASGNLRIRTDKSFKKAYSKMVENIVNKLSRGTTTVEFKEIPISELAGAGELLVEGTEPLSKSRMKKIVSSALKKKIGIDSDTAWPTKNLTREQINKLFGETKMTSTNKEEILRADLKFDLDLTKDPILPVKAKSQVQYLNPRTTGEIKSREKTWASGKIDIKEEERVALTMDALIKFMKRKLKDGAKNLLEVQDDLINFINTPNLSRLISVLQILEENSERVQGITINTTTGIKKADDIIKEYTSLLSKDEVSINEVKPILNNLQELVEEILSLDEARDEEDEEDEPKDEPKDEVQEDEDLEDEDEDLESFVETLQENENLDNLLTKHKDVLLEHVERDRDGIASKKSLAERIDFLAEDIDFEGLLRLTGTKFNNAIASIEQSEVAGVTQEVRTKDKNGNDVVTQKPITRWVVEKLYDVKEELEDLFKNIPRTIMSSIETQTKIVINSHKEFNKLAKVELQELDTQWLNSIDILDEIVDYLTEEAAVINRANIVNLEFDGELKMKGAEGTFTIAGKFEHTVELERESTAGGYDFSIQEAYARKGSKRIITGRSDVVRPLGSHKGTIVNPFKQKIYRQVSQSLNDLAFRFRETDAI